MTTDTLALTLVQDDFQPHAVEENTVRAREHLEQAPPDSLVVFPELALTGYGIGGRARELAVSLKVGDPAPAELSALAGTHASALVGLVERGDDHRVFNASALMASGAIQAVQRKRYLPTYGMFDEGRIFAPDRSPPQVIGLADGWRVGVLICEDLWHPALSWLLAMQGADLIVVQAAAPGRDGPDAGGQGFASMERWTLLARATAVQFGLYVGLSNRCGVEAGFTFGGGSLLMDPMGQEVWRAGGMEATRFDTSLSRDLIRSSREPFSHIRDEDPTLVLRGIRAFQRGAAGQ